MLSEAWRSLCSSAPALRHGQGRRRQDDRGGRARARRRRRGRRTIVCEVAEQDRVSRAFAREGVQREQEVELAENLWAISIDPTAALQEWLGRQLGGPALRLITGSSAFQHFVAAAPGAKELITIAKVWELAQLERWDAAQPHLRPRHRRRARLRARPGDAHGAEHVRRDRARRADPAPGVQGPRHARRPAPDRLRRGRAARGDAGQRDARARRRGCTTPIGLGLDAIVVNGSTRRASAARRPTSCARPPRTARPDALAAVRAALAEHERAQAQRTHLRRLKREAGAPVHTLPFLFDAEVGLDEYPRSPPSSAATSASELAAR